MGDNNQDPRLHNQQYYQNSQQPQHVFQQQMYMQQMGGQPQYGYDNQMYAAHGNYPEQYPQQYYEQEYDDDDYDNLAAIDKELNHSRDEEEEFVAQAEKEVFRPTDNGATPWANGQLSQHAADFWFPESRNCTCCAGFKHGCKCCKSGKGVISCTDPGCVDQEFSQQVNSSLAARGPPTPSTTSSSSAAPAVSSPPKPSSSSAPSVAGEVCRFEASPGGCRFGATCRFKHNFPPNPAAAAAAPAPAGPPGSKPRCTFFAKGHCQFGDACRNGHY